MSVRTRPPSRAGRARKVPVWQPLTWEKTGLAAVPGLDPAPEAGRGRVIALRATPGARAGGWAARAAAEIAAAEGAQGARVLLVDLFLDEPHLHDAFGARNLEGIADLVSYGASLGRIARAAGDGSFRVATAGTPVADARAVLDQPRWRNLVEHLVDDGVTLLAYQPAESVVHPEGSPSIVLARKGEPMAALGATGLRYAVAVLGPPAGGAAVAAVSGSGRTLGEQGYRVSLWDDGEPEQLPEPEPEQQPELEQHLQPEVGQSAKPEVEQPPEAGPEQAPKPEAGQPPRPEPAQSAAAGTDQAVPVEAHESSAAEAHPAPVAEATAGADAASEPARVRGRGLSVSAFVVLVLFATVMILMGIDNAGIAEVPGADRFRELFEVFLERISGFFTR